ncbi:MAG: hypothetical protein U0169_02255 [Polyangiaceae bacterium]
MFTKTGNSTDDSDAAPSFLSRMLANDTLRKGVAGALAGVLVAAVSETLWPSDR